MGHRIILTVLVLATYYGSTVLAGEEVSNATSYTLRTERLNPTIVRSVANNDCYTAALLNGLLAGPQKFADAAVKVQQASKDPALALQQVFGKRKSRNFEGFDRMRSDGCMADEDIADLCNDVLSDLQIGTARGLWLNRNEDEIDKAFVRRVHQIFRSSIADGKPLLLSYSMGAAVPRSDNPNRRAWEYVFGHAVTIVGVQNQLEEGAKGFSIEFIDSNKGRVMTGYVYAEQREFGAFRGTYDKAVYITGKPYLAMVAPDAPGADGPGYESSDRTVIVLRHAVIFETATKQP